jgi:copper(I)-binding protein
MKPYLTFVTLLLAVAVMAAQCTPGTTSQESGDPEITIDEPYARAAIPNGAVFMELVNEGAVDDVLISAETEVANNVELHESKIDEAGVMRMSPVPNIPVPAGGSATLQPGGLHVMLMGLNRELAVGDTFSVTLNFEKSSPKTIEVEVRDSIMGQMEHGEGEMDSMSPGDDDTMEGMNDDQQ